MLCCACFLYKWFISHVFKDMYVVENMNGYKWYQYLVSLTEKSILWYPQILNREDMIISCGDFPNVPLIGSKGYISYNPTLSMRQLDFPLTYKPSDKLLEGFVLHDLTVESPTLFRATISRKELIKEKVT